MWTSNPSRFRNGPARRRSYLPRLEQLEPRERTIVYLRFFGSLTQQEISDRLGLSQVHVSRLLRRSLDQLHAAIAPPES